MATVEAPAPTHSATLPGEITHTIPAALVDLSAAPPAHITDDGSAPIPPYATVFGGTGPQFVTHTIPTASAASRAYAPTHTVVEDTATDDLDRELALLLAVELV